MLLEAIGKPLRYKLRSGEEVRLEPGYPVELPDKSARSLLKQAGERVRVVTAPVPTIQPGDTITWLRGGKSQEGKVDFLHTDDTGTLWAFVDLPGGQWAAVNMQFATVHLPSIPDEQGL